MEACIVKIDLLQQLRNDNPMVLNIANSVTQSDVANGLAALGASPLMTNYDTELKTLTQMTGGVCVNIGTLDDRQNSISNNLMELATEFNKPLVLDPVGIGAVPERLEVVEDLLRIAKPTIIRGNAGEVASLVGAAWSSKGIDSLDKGQTQDVSEMAQACAKKFSCVVVVTGETDTIATADKIAKVYNGTPMFKTHVGTGDMLSSILSAFAAVSEGDFYEAAKVGCLVFSIAGEIVMNDYPEIGPSEFGIKLIDKLYQITVDDVEEWGKYDD
nr:hydroxyethylthiazole kinase [Companilactobacillus mishanensis]